MSIPYVRLAAGACILVAGAITYLNLTALTDDDIAYSEGLRSRIEGKLIRAGDLMVVSPDGTTLPEQLCQLSPPDGVLTEVPHNKVYYNRLPAVVDYILSRVTNSGAANTEIEQGRSFHGKFTNIPGDRLSPMDNNCACAVKKALLRRAKVCVVDQSLVEMRQEISSAGTPELVLKTLGFTLRSQALVIDPDAEVPGCITTNSQPMVPQVSSCAGIGRDYALQVRMRGTLGVIGEEDFSALQPQ